MKIAIITGGSRGLGRNMAKHLAQQGHGVILTYHSQAQEADGLVDELAKAGHTAVALQLDVTRPEQFDGFAGAVKEALAGTWQREQFDWLVNNAGMGVHAGFTDTTPEQFDLLTGAHLKAPFFLTQKLLPLMRDGGAVLNVSSGLTRFSYPGYAAYATMKGGVEVLTRYLAKELGPRRIRVNCLAPGAIETDFGGGAVRDNADINRMIAAQTALGRVGLPDDIGAAVASILSDEMGWVNGQRIEASGGVHL